jgi:hypothetical protein
MIAQNGSAGRIRLCFALFESNLDGIFPDNQVNWIIAQAALLALFAATRAGTSQAPFVTFRRVVS